MVGDAAASAFLGGDVRPRRDVLSARRGDGVIAGLALATIVAFAVRVAALGDQGLWFDETYTAFIVQLPPGEAWRALVADGVHPPLYYLLMRIALLWGRSETALRLPSAILGSLTIPLVYAVCRDWLGRKPALLAAAFLALSPFHVWMSREARMYAALAFLTVAGIGAYAQIMRRRSGWAALAFCLTHAAAYLTHYFGLMLPLIELIDIIARLPDRARGLRRWTVLQAVSGLPLIGWVAVLSRRDAQIFGIGWVPQPSLVDLGKTFVNFSVGSLPSLEVWQWPGVILAAGLLALGMRRAWKEPGAKALVLVWGVIPAVTSFLFSLRRPVYMDRFLIGSLPAVGIAVAAGLGTLGPRLRAAAGVGLGLVLAASTAVFCFGPDQQKEEWREAGALLAQVPSDQVIVVRTLQIVIPLRYYGPAEAPMEVLEVNRQVASLTELSAGYGGAWLVYWNAAADAHLVAASPAFDPSQETDPTASAWLSGDGPRLNRRVDLVGITLLQFEGTR
jgi:mannosyltransferase